MRVRVNDRVLEGRGIDVPGVSSEMVLRAVTRESDPVPAPSETYRATAWNHHTIQNRRETTEVAPQTSRQSPNPGVISIEAPTPGPGHVQLGRVPVECSLRRALAAAGRSRGETSPQDRQIAQLERTLAELDPPSVNLAAARRRVADTGNQEDRLRERIATLRGELHARRKLDADTGSLETELQEAAAELSEAETERIAAEQALKRERERARNARDIRERRLELQDELANRRRSARAVLARRLYPDFAAALQRVPGEAAPGGSPGEFEGDPAAATLAAVRIARLSAPVVLVFSESRFPSADVAAAQLDTRVLRVAADSCPPDATDSTFGERAVSESHLSTEAGIAPDTGPVSESEPVSDAESGSGSGSGSDSDSDSSSGSEAVTNVGPTSVTAAESDRGSGTGKDSESRPRLNSVCESGRPDDLPQP